MAVEKWVTVGRKTCRLIGEQIELREQRIYPSAHMPDPAGYHVRGRACSTAIACNLAGVRCRWAFTNPDVDRYELD